MSLVPAAPPQPVPMLSGSTTVPSTHGAGASTLGQVRVGPMRGLAVNPADGHVFTANGDDRSVSQVDPRTLKVLRSINLPQVLDALD